MCPFVYGSACDVLAEGRTDGPRVDCTEFNPATTVIKASQQSLFVRDQVSRPSYGLFSDSRRRRQQIARDWSDRLEGAVALPPLRCTLGASLFIIIYLEC